MKIDKKKIVFAGIILVILAFIVIYSILILKSDDEYNSVLKQTVVPKLEDNGHTFSSKKDAVDAIKEKRENHVPSLYDVKFLDSTGQYDPYFFEKEKQRIIDSIYRLGNMNYYEGNYSKNMTKPSRKSRTNSSKAPKEDNSKTLKEMALKQELFFDVNPAFKNSSKEYSLLVEVNGKQTIRANDRLQMRVIEESELNGLKIEKNSLIYGTVRFQPNRVLLTIDNINHNQIDLKAYDFQDGLEGIYIKNSFRAEVQKEITKDVISDINVPGIPQIKGVDRVFQRTNRNVKVTVNDNYRLILKSETDTKY